MTRRALAVGASIASITLASLLIASPASAATLPSGQRISTVGLIDDPDEQFFDVSPADATSTPYGTPQDLWPIEALDVDDDGIGWAIQQQTVEGDGIPVLRPADAKTGTLGPGVPIVPADAGVDVDICRGLAMLPDGTLIVGCNDAGEQSILTSYIGVLGTDGTFTDRIQFEDEAVLDIRAIAHNAVTNELWVFGLMPNDGNIATVSQLILGDFWTLGESLEMDNIVESADFDRDGQLFALYLVPEDVPHLGTVDLVTTDITDIGRPTSAGEDTVLRAIAIWGKPALPATGPAEIVPIGLGTALLFLAGAAFIATQRIQRRAGEH